MIATALSPIDFFTQWFLNPDTSFETKKKRLRAILYAAFRRDRRWSTHLKQLYNCAGIGMDTWLKRDDVQPMIELLRSDPSQWPRDEKGACPFDWIWPEILYQMVELEEYGTGGTTTAHLCKDLSDKVFDMKDEWYTNVLAAGKTHDDGTTVFFHHLSSNDPVTVFLHDILKEFEIGRNKRFLILRVSGTIRPIKGMGIGTAHTWIALNLG